MRTPLHISSRFRKDLPPSRRVVETIFIRPSGSLPKTLFRRTDSAPSVAQFIIVSLSACFSVQMLDYYEIVAHLPSLRMTDSFFMLHMFFRQLKY
jgi:hypothetical protein